MKAAALVVAGVLLAGSARADEPAPEAVHKPTSSLSWVRLPGAESCLAAAALSTRVEAKLGRPAIVSPSQADLAIEARAEPVPRSTHVRVVVNGTKRDGTTLGSRVLVGETCAGLEESLVLVLALMIDPDATAPAPVVPAPAAPVPIAAPVVSAPVAAPAPVAPVAPAPTVRAKPEPRWGAEAHGAFVLAIERSPRVAPALFVGGMLVPPRFVPIEVGFFALPSDSTSSATRHASVTELAGSLALCPRWAVASRVRAGVCAGLWVGAFLASGAGFATNTNERALLADVRLAPRIELDVTSSIYLYGAPGLTLPLARQRIAFTDAAQRTAFLYERPTLGVDVALGLGVRFLP